MKVTIAHLYADTMNLYGDRGNILALRRRCEWRGIDAEMLDVGVGAAVDADRVDLIFVGGGQDRDQLVVCEDFKGIKGTSIKEAVETDCVLLAVCGGYQLLGHYFRTSADEVLPGIGLFDAYTVAGPRRLIGNVVVESELGGVRRTLVGFENHSGQTFLNTRGSGGSPRRPGHGMRPLGRVLVGHGNNGTDRTEGAVYRNAFGSYLHGSLLPKNPWFVDHLLTLALRRRYGNSVALAPLDDRFEERAHAAVVERIAQIGHLRTGVR